MAYVKKRREECVLFLDDGFSAESVAIRLRTAGFTVQRFPEIINFCAKNGWLLVTADHEMKNTHRGEIARTDVAILSTAHNSADDPNEWTIAIINLKSRILREFKNHERPWFATFSRTAKLKIQTIRPVAAPTS